MPNIGRIGENKAATYLQKKGYLILEKNAYSRFGEIDIICRTGNTVVFVEVKTRTNATKGKPYEAVTYRKLLHLKRTIDYYLVEKKLYNLKHRLDVISIDYNQESEKFVIQHFENVAFERR